jgi:hypothetical protein
MKKIYKLDKIAQSKLTLRVQSQDNLNKNSN